MSAAAMPAPLAPELSASSGRVFVHRVATSWQGASALAILAIVLGTALLAPWIAPWSPIDVDVERITEGPSALHWAGTDEIGRDVLSRVMHGAGVSLQVVALSVGIAMLVGSAIGLVSGWFGGWVDAAMMRAMDALLAFPLLVLALTIVAILGPDLLNAMLAIAITKVPGFARVVPAEVLGLRQVDFVKAARAGGASDGRILARHVWPNVSGNVIVYGSLAASQALITESALSFLGLGAQPPAPSWGYMVATGMEYATSWWMSVFPGLAIFLTVLAFNFLGDAARDALDSRLLHKDQ